MTDIFNSLSKRVRKRLTALDVTTVEQLAALSPSRLLRVPGLGRDSLREIREFLSGRSLALQEDHRPLEPHAPGPPPEEGAIFTSRINAGIRFSHSLEWRRFAWRITRHPFIRNALANHQGNQCPVCKMPVSATSGSDVHHIDYNWTCTQERDVEIPTGRLSRRGHRRVHLAPDCERCAALPDSPIAACLLRLALLHPACHAKIHAALNKCPGADPSATECVQRWLSAQARIQYLGARTEEVALKDY